MLVGIVLVVAGLALVAVTAWFWNSARPDNPVLAPLEVMGDDAYLNADEETRKELIRQARAEVFARLDDDGELR